MIIVEGPDGAGKTTLIEQLLDHPEFQLEKGPRAATSENGPLDNLRGWVDDQLKLDSQRDHRRLLYDRHPLISDMVYGPLIRGRTSEGFDDFGWLHTKLNQLKNMNPLIVYCLPSRDQVKMNVEANHEGKTEHLRGVLRTTDAIYDLYTYHAAMSPFFTQTWVWDYNNSYFADLCMVVRSFCNGH